jgi:hypothetical protein
VLLEVSIHVINVNTKGGGPYKEYFHSLPQTLCPVSSPTTLATLYNVAKWRDPTYHDTDCPVVQSLPLPVVKQEDHSSAEECSAPSLYDLEVISCRFVLNPLNFADCSYFRISF